METRFTDREHSRVRIETREDGGRVITGYAAVFYRADDPGTEYELWPGLVERMAPTVFRRGLKGGADDVRSLFNHNPDNLLGRTSAGTLTLTTDETGLLYELPVDEADIDHLRVVRKIERGDLTGSSIIFNALRSTFIEGEDGPDIRILEDVRLFDTGPVTFPAYESTTTGMRDATGVDDARAEYDAWKTENAGTPNLDAARQRMDEHRQSLK